jgi:hypothetical protein
MTAAVSGILSFDDLVQRIQDWIFGRVDLAAQAPTFIQLFEAKANRTLFVRQMETRSVATCDPNSAQPQYLSLPSGFQTMRRVRLLNGASPDQPKLKFLTGQQMDDKRETVPGPGDPIWFTLFGEDMELLPTPNAASQIEMIYRVNIPPLGPAQQTNWLLQQACDAYLYGALMEVAPYLHDDDRIPVWSAGVQKAIDDLNELSNQALYNAGPLVMRGRRSGYS